MQDLKYDTEDRICALATPWAPSALAVIRLSGPGSIEAFAEYFSRPRALRDAAGSTAVYGHVIDGSGQPLDEVLATVFRAPRSYTGQDGVEISCHGSLPGLRRILAALQGEGATRGAFRPAGPGEFTLRAFMNGKLDLTRAEAVQELVAARTEAAQALALNRLSGSVEQRIRVLTGRMLELTALLNIQLDYAEDDVETVPVPFEVLDAVRSELENLAATFRTGHLYQEGIRLVLAGRTNAGKSSLFNLFLKEDRSIVSDEHGTTRDWLESWVSLSGIPIRLYDTAGLRDAENGVEREGIRRTRELIDAADLVLYLIAGDEGANAEDAEFLEAWKDDGRLLVVTTKADLQTGIGAALGRAALSPAGELGRSAEGAAGGEFGRSAISPPEELGRAAISPAGELGRSVEGAAGGELGRSAISPAGELGRSAISPPEVLGRSTISPPGHLGRSTEVPRLAVSAKTGLGFEALEAAILKRLPGASRSEGGGPVIDSLRQKQLLDRAIAALDQVRQGAQLGVPIDMIALDVKDALDALGEITGEVTTADVLDAMFSRFCVGK